MLDPGTQKLRASLGNMLGAKDDGSNEGPTQKEFEVLSAELESRLRGAILRLVRPTLDQTADMSQKLDQMQHQVDNHEDMICTAEHLRGEVKQLREHSQMLEDQIVKRDKQMREVEAKSSAQVTELGGHIRDLDQKLERAQAELRRQNRDVQRVWDEATRLQAMFEQTTQTLRNEVEATNKRTERTREELLEMCQTLQTHHDDLMEELFGDLKVVHNLKSDIKELQAFVEPLPELEKTTAAVAHDIGLLQVKVGELGEEVLEGKDLLADSSKVIHDQMEVMREDLRVKSNQLTAHHAAVMTDIRNDYAEEIGASRKMREDIEAFQLKTNSFCENVGRSLASESNRMDSLSRELREDLEDLQRKRKKDRIGLDSEMFQIRRDGHTAREYHQVLRQSVEYLGKILGLVLEGERLSNALAIQDFTDRQGEKWLVPLADQDRQPQASVTADHLLEQHHRHRDFKNVGKLCGPIDWRQGLPQDSYKPGQVTFRGVSYDRRELLVLHHKLLHKAQKAYSERWNMADADVAATAVHSNDKPSGAIKGQPCAVGGAAAGRVPHEKVPPSTMKASSVDNFEDEDDARPQVLRAMAGSRQRPGSQGQPSAGGSRGTMHGSLGETEPPLGSMPCDGLGGRSSARGSNRTPPLRLPELGVERGVASEKFNRGDDKWGTVSTAPGTARAATTAGSNSTNASNGAFPTADTSTGRSGGGNLPLVGKPLSAR